MHRISPLPPAQTLTPTPLPQEEGLQIGQIKFERENGWHAIGLICIPPSVLLDCKNNSHRGFLHS